MDLKRLEKTENAEEKVLRHVARLLATIAIRVACTNNRSETCGPVMSGTGTGSAEKCPAVNRAGEGGEASVPI